MLSRVADAVYWMGRYLERAEHCTRLLLVTEDFSTEVHGLDEELARSEWNDLLRIFPGSRLGRQTFPKYVPFAVPYLTAFFLDELNPYSTSFSLKKARDNARAVREALTVEVFLSLNDAYHALEKQARVGIKDVPAFRDALSAIQKGLLATVGAVEHTLTRDQGWFFLKLGESLERVSRTALVLTAKLPALLAHEPKADLPLYYTRWRSLLRSLASLENYRAACGAEMEPERVIRFMLFDQHAPRALNFGAHAVQGYLDRIARSDTLTPAARAIGKLCSRLSYEDREVMGRTDFIGFLADVLGELERTHEAIVAQYFVT
jgi:uncharacterized alpha-E superfamily protein